MKMNYKLFRRWENPVLGKYYLAYVARDLFGGWNLVKAWGKVGETTGGLAYMPCQSWDEAMQLFGITHQKRLRCGYQPACVKC